MIYKHYIIYSLFLTLASAAIPGIPDSLGPIKFPSLDDELFKMPGGIDPPRILLDFINAVPTIKMAVGTPKQDFIAVFDTATPITYVISDKCNATICNNFEDSQKFHVQQSTSNFQFPFQIDLTYLDGSSARLKPELDKVTFADIFTFQRHLIAEAYDIQNAPAIRPPINARLGLGNFGSINWFKSKLIYDGPNPLSSIMPPGILPGFLPGKRAGAEDRYSTGEVQSGSASFKKRGLGIFAWILGVDKKLYTGPIYDIPLITISGLESPFWKMTVTNLQFRNAPNTSGQNLLTSSLKGQIFSSSPDLLVPRSLSEQMNKALGAVFDSSTGRFAIDCSKRQTGPDLIFQFEGGVTAEIAARLYISEENGHCYTLINSPVVDTKYILLGGPFFRSFYIVYQFGARKIGLAESIAKRGKVYKS